MPLAPRPRSPMYEALTQAAEIHGVPRSLLFGVAYVESRYQPMAQSAKGAMGMMQLMPGTAEALGVRDPFDPWESADAAAGFLAALERQYGNWPTALAAYNWGQGNVNSGEPWPEDTQQYVANVLDAAGMLGGPGLEPPVGPTLEPFYRPVANAVIPTKGNASFGVRRTAQHTHQGVDIGASIGTPVSSVTDGIVVHSSRRLENGFSGYGRFIVVEATPLGPWLMYAHLDRVLVEPGQTVFRGEAIGTVGRTCYTRAEPDRLCGGSHLHFEVSPSPYPQDSEAPRYSPIAWLREHAQFGPQRGMFAQFIYDFVHPFPLRRT